MRHDVGLGRDPADDRDRQLPALAHGAHGSQRAGSTIATMRSWDSLIITSNGSSQGSRRGIASRSTSIPVAPRSAVSQVAQVMPAAPRSWTRRPARGRSARGRLDQQLLRKRVAHRTDGRLEGSWSPNVADASTDAPPIPSRPVAEPYSTTRLPGRPPTPGSASRPPAGRGHHVDQRVALVRGDEHELAAEVGTPTQLP